MRCKNPLARALLRSRDAPQELSGAWRRAAPVLRRVSVTKALRRQCRRHHGKLPHPKLRGVRSHLEVFGGGLAGARWTRWIGSRAGVGGGNATDGWWRDAGRRALRKSDYAALIRPTFFAVRHRLGHRSHHGVVVDPVEELLQIDIDPGAKAGTDVVLRTVHRLMGHRSLMAADFATFGSLVRPGRPHNRFLSIGPRYCSTLPPGPPAERRRCASLILRRHQAG